MTVINIDIVSDIVCIWCFIGKRTVEKAVHLYQKTYPDGKNDTFVVKWRPYYLNPNTSTQSIDKAELLKIKFKDVSSEKMAAMSNRVQQIAMANGINFSFKGKIGSTSDAHRLIYLSQLETSPGSQNELVEKLFQAYHEKEMDISDRQVLTEIATAAGFDSDKVRQWLSSDRAEAEVNEEARKNREHVTTGVPTFIVQHKHRVDGAQDLQEFYDAFVKVKQEESQGR